MKEQQKIDKLFQQVRGQKPQVSFDQTKAVFLKSLETDFLTENNPKKITIFTFKNKIIMSAIIGSIILLCSLLFIQKKSQNDLKNKIVTKFYSDKSQAKIKENAAIIRAIPKNLQLNDSSYLTTSPSLSLSKIEDQVFENVEKDPEIRINTFQINVNDDYVFPKLTKEEIDKTLKQKKKMLKILAKYGNEYYTYIPAGSYKYNEKIISVNGFYIQKSEVSNLEYRTFLFDLLINDRKEEFLKAKPDQNQWIKALDSSYVPMKNLYFSDEGFNDYPVVNISKEGAEMYCLWLTEEIRKFVGEKKEIYYEKIRLPYREEWVKAASVDGNQLPYPWGKDTLKTQSGGYYANFKTESKELNSTIGIQPAQKYSFPCNFWALYNLSGNVAEMVYDYPGFFQERIIGKQYMGTIGTAGGGWMNTAEEIKIYAPENHQVVVAHPNIGFRVVFNYFGKNVYRSRIRLAEN